MNSSLAARPSQRLALLLAIFMSGVFLALRWTLRSSIFMGGMVAAANSPASVEQTTDYIFVPVVLSAAGINGSFFTSELTLTNRTSQEAVLHFGYVGSADFDGGKGTGTDRLAASQQRIVEDAISYLRSLGIPIPSSGDRLGTLRINVDGIAPASLGVTVRTTTASANGRAGLAYSGILSPQLLNGAAVIGGLRQDTRDRSNVALQNAGTEGDGDITLRLTVYSGEKNAVQGWTLPLETLQPGGFKQISGILGSNGLSLTEGMVRIERISGTAPFYAYAVVNDQDTSDGSFITPRLADDPRFAEVGQEVVPAIVENGSFATEVVMSNMTDIPKVVVIGFNYAVDDSPGHFSACQFELGPGEQRIFPNFVQFLRGSGIPPVEPSGPGFAGVLYGTPAYTGGRACCIPAPTDFFLGARTLTRGNLGRYGVFYPAFPYSSLSSTELWLYGLQQDEQNRSNVALVKWQHNDPDILKVEIFDGDRGTKAATVPDVQLNNERWLQLNSVLRQYAPGVRQGYARVSLDHGPAPFLAYAVVNDGGIPGERTGDGAFISSSP